jgi:hypothetical protein
MAVGHVELLTRLRLEWVENITNWGMEIMGEGLGLYF